MKKITFSFKSLLLAAGLLLGSANAWAGDVYTIVYGTPTYTDEVITGVTPQTDFTSDDGNTASNVTSSDANGANCTNAMPIGGSVLYSSANFTKSFASPATKGTVHFEANYTTTTNGQETWQILDSKGVEIFGTTDAGYSNGNATKIWGFCNGVSLGTNWFRQARSTHNRVVLDINLSTKKVSYTVLVSSGNNSYSTLTGTYDLPAAVNDVATFKANKQSYYSYMDNVSFYNVYDDAVSLYDYTVNYKLGDNLVKTFSSSAAAGNVITAESVIDGTEEGYVGNHYLITAGSAPSMTITSGTNVLDVPVRAPYTATLTVTKNIDGEAQTPEVTNLVETDAKVCSWIYAYPMYVEKGGVYYVADVTSTFGESGNFTNGQSISKTVNYTNAAPDVVWFKDINAGSVSNVAYSGGSYTNTNEQLANVTVDAGVYEVIFNVVSKAGSGSHHRNEGVSVNGKNVANLTGDVSGLRSLTINVANDESVITAYGNGTSNYTDNLDYVLIKKVADYEVVLTSSANLEGYKTFCSAVSNYQVDANTTIYKGSATKETVTLTSVDGNIIPKNTPVVLKTTNTTDYTIALTATETASTGDFEGNALQVAAGGETGVYILAYTTAYGFGFYNFTGTLDAGDVHLAIPLSVKMLNVVVDGTATGVEAPEVTEAEEEEILYNTAGVRVGKDYKGIVINQKGEKRLQK